MITKTIKKLALDDLTVDLRVQRVEGVDRKRVARINGAFDPLALGTILVSARPDGSYVVLDGMHRCEFARAHGYTKPMDAIVLTGLTLADEARLFVLYNDMRVPSAISRFSARVIMGDPAAVACDSILTAHGWKIAFDSHDGNFAAVEAIDIVYRNAAGVLPNGEHFDVTNRTIEIITQAWDHDRKSGDGFMVKGMGQLVGRLGDHLDYAKLRRELQDTMPGLIIGKAKALRDAQGGTVPAALAKVLVGLHNRGRRSNLLPEWVWVR